MWENTDSETSLGESGCAPKDWRDPTGYDDTGDPDAAYELSRESSWGWD